MTLDKGMSVRQSGHWMLGEYFIIFYEKFEHILFNAEDLQALMNILKDMIYFKYYVLWIKKKKLIYNDI